MQPAMFAVVILIFLIMQCKKCCCGDDDEEEYDENDTAHDVSKEEADIKSKSTEDHVEKETDDGKS